MLWVDQDQYTGPDRRKARGLRIHDRRRDNFASQAPALRTALTQLRLHVIDCEGASGVAKFVRRVDGVAALASLHGARPVARILCDLSAAIKSARINDLRETIYSHIDRACVAL